MKIKIRFLASTLMTFYACSSQAAVDITGFATAGYIGGDLDHAFLSGSDVITKSATFGADNILGLQVNADINSNVDVTGQFIAKGVEEGYKTYARWAYISYEFSPEFTMRMGRMNFPGALYSDVQEVGFSYPWIRNPVEVYTVMPITSHSGMDVFYQFTALDVDWVLQTSVGSFPPFNTMGSTLEIDRAYGASLVGNTTYGKLSCSLINTKNTNIGISAGDQNLNINVDFTFATVGLGLEFDKLVVISEIIKRDVQNNTASDIYSQSDMLAYYLTLGYRFGDFLPHFTYSGSQSDYQARFFAAGSALPGPPPQGIPVQYWVAPADMMVPGNLELMLQKSYTAGVRYDVNSQTDFKVEVQRIIPDEGSWGVFFSDPGDHADLISLAVDVVF